MDYLIRNGMSLISQFGCEIHQPCLRLSFNCQFVIHGYDHYRKWRSAVVANNRKMAAKLIASKHWVLVVGGEHHDVRMPVPAWPQNLIG